LQELPNVFFQRIGGSIFDRDIRLDNCRDIGREGEKMTAPLLTFDGYSSLMRGALSVFANGANGSRVRLFKNNYTPDQNTHWVDFIEADFSGYAPCPTPLAIDQGLQATQFDLWKFNSATFTMTSAPGQMVYGYWIDFFDPTTSLRVVLWAQRFNSPFYFSGPGISLPVILTPGFRQAVYP
jgi:hypothetical protein